MTISDIIVRRHDRIMTANRNRNNNKNNNRNRKERERERRLKSSIGYIIVVLVLTAAAVSLSVIGSYFFVGPLSLPGLLCTLVAASALFACVIFLTNRGIMIPAGILSFSITYMTSGDMTGASVSTAYIFVGAFIYFGIKNSKTKKLRENGARASYSVQAAERAEKRQFRRTQITVAAAGFLSVFYAAIIIANIFISTISASNGTFSVGAVSSAIDGELTRHIENYVGMFPQPQYASSGESAYPLEDIITELAMNFKAVLPALFIAFNLAAAYLATALFRFAYNIFIPLAISGRKRIKNKYWRINMSVISAIIMIISIFAAMMFSGMDNLLPVIVLTNMIYILIPGFCVMGVYFFCDKMTDAGIGKITVFILICVPVAFSFLFPFLIPVIIVILMVLGLFAALIGDIKKFYEKVKKLMFGDEDDEDDDYLD